MSHTGDNGLALARGGAHPGLFGRLLSGWAVLCDMNNLSGYSILLANPLVAGLNDLTAEARAGFYRI